MRLPSKLTSFDDSTLADLAPVLSQIDPEGTSLTVLNDRFCDHERGTYRFIEALTVLYALRKIEMNADGVIQIAA